MLRTICAAIGAFLLALSAAPPAGAQTPLFAEEGELEITIESPLSDLVRAAPRSTDPYPAVLVIAGSETRYDMELSARGVSRRTGGICSFPPLRLNLRRGAMRGTVFEGQNRLKLVTRCRPGPQYEQINAREMLAYRLYNALTDQSYRVRPVRVNFIDTGRGGRAQVQHAFLIEDVDDVARRNGMVELEVPVNTLTPAQLDRAAATRYALFQYLIGNLDWDMVSGRAGEECCHNSRLLAASTTTRANIVPAPYDFDYSGLVNAPYAIPAEQFNVASVRTRVYRGYCAMNDEVPAAVAHFRARREAINAAIAESTRLSASARQNVQRYIDEFFGVIDNPAALERQIIGRCRSG